VRISPFTTVAHNAAQNDSDNFPSYHPDNLIIAQMMSSGGEGVQSLNIEVCIGI